ncbi:MAG TPA: tetratricopeptide repeat protein [Polyangia bacterium]|nr:tetratricopeptide repeat protein [Polyangia bacterium]
MSFVRGFIRSVRSVAAALAVIVTVGSGAARAAGPAGGDEKQARALYESAEKSFNVGKFAEALADYQAAYEAKPLPGFLFNIAQCYRNMGNYERARFFFRRYLSIEPKAPNHRRVEELINEMSRQIDAQAAAAAAAPSATSAPPAPPSTSPPPAEVRPAEAAAEPTPEVKPAEPLPAAPAEAASASPPTLVTAAPRAEGAARPVWKRWWFWTGVGAVVAGGVVAAFFLTRPRTVIPGSLDHIDGRM